MLKSFAKKYSNRFVSKWLILAVDCMIVILLFFFAYLVRFNFRPELAKDNFTIYQVPYTFLVYLLGFILFGSYAGIIRHTTVKDSVKMFSALSFSALLTAFVTYYVQQNFDGHPLNVPFSIALIHYLLCTFVLINSRILIKIIFYNLSGSSKISQNVLIYGAGTLGLITKNTFDHAINSRYKVVGFIEDSNSKIGKSMQGLKVYSPNQVLNADFIAKENIHAVILAIKDMSISRKREIADICLNLNLEIKVIPEVEKWINGELSVNAINNVKIEDLLGRDSIQLDIEKIRDGLNGKVMMVTGAAGSIGSEMVRQLIHFNPARLILVDQAETPLNDIQVELQHKISPEKVEFIIADVSNKNRVEKIFKNFKPQVVFHAAAYKHVPVMESNPYEAIRVNVGGTKLLADLSVEHNVEKFVMISTDKAVNPTNVMGASKRIAEMYTRSLNKTKGKTKFIITRFGNVLGSNGSVIPLFRKQIESGGPVTVTDERITRYFMTIPEACQLVLEAAFMGKEGQIYVFDMGESVKIIDLAKKMIKLSGLTIGQDIEIKITGLRPGEKLYEELLTNAENTIPTHNPKIMIGKVPDYDFHELIIKVSKLVENLSFMTDEEIVGQMKEIVPEFISNNSVFSKLDQ